MTIILPVLAAAFAAFCVSGSECGSSIGGRRWAMQTIATVIVVVLAGYPLSMGPAMKHTESILLPTSTSEMIHRFYEPIFWACGNAGTMPALYRYLEFCGAGPYRNCCHQLHILVPYVDNPDIPSRSSRSSPVPPTIGGQTGKSG